MPDAQRAAARFLRIALWLGAALVILAGVLDWAAFPGLARGVGAVGVGVVVAAPFGALVVIAVVARKSATAAYAVVSVLLAVVGLLLAA
ncbi:MAG: hypothetical protein OEY20_11530 [Gemmatimonadota bacterium]|nr:hypothetical protein [Gemmatimonadota bacterium]MDH5197871.1 hypothetical protein [Gemmatimonadota bacterium]